LLFKRNMPRTDASDIVKQRRLAAIVNGSVGSAGIPAKGPPAGGFLAGASRMGAILSLFTPAQKALAIAAALVILNYQKFIVLPLNFSNYSEGAVTFSGNLLFDNDGNKYCVELTRKCIAKIDTSENVTVFKEFQRTPVDFCKDSNGNLYVLGSFSGSSLIKIDTSGNITPLTLNFSNFTEYDGTPISNFIDFTGGLVNTRITIDSSDNLFVALESVVCKIDSFGNVTTFGTNFSTSALRSEFSDSRLSGICIDSNDTLYLSSMFGVFKIDKFGNVDKASKNLTNYINYTNSSNLSTRGVCADNLGNIYAADVFGTVAKIDKFGNVSTLLPEYIRSLAFNSAWGIGIDKDNNLYFYRGTASGIVKIFY